VITGLKRISKPGRRMYVGVEEIRGLKHRLSLVIVSTSKGLMADRNAHKQRVGGEPLLLVW
jgi:small subunit ribosomal protein S8